jgi:hypothetical protein
MRCAQIQIEPLAVHPSIDRFQAWLPKPATYAELRQLRSDGLIYVINAPARFDHRYLQCLQFLRPRKASLDWLAPRSDALLNRIEIALDYIFDCRRVQDSGLYLLHRSVVRRWHSPKQEIRLYRADSLGRPIRVYDIFDAETRYDAGRWARNVMITYREHHSRITGEPYVLHHEWRANGAQAVRATGINSPRDLLNFDHRAFWQRRFLLYEIDEELLGRLLRNRNERTRRRAEQRCGLKSDRRVGQTFSASYSTVQEIIDGLRHLVRIDRALVPLPIEPWLPPST